jgi:uncharacterized protein
MVTEHRTSVGALTRRDGVTLCAIVGVGYVIGELLGVIADAIARLGFHDHRSLTKLAELSQPPWWFVAAGLVGLWIGFCLAALYAGRRFQIFNRQTFRFRRTDVVFIVIGVALQFLVDLLDTSVSIHHISEQNNKIFGSPTGGSFVLLAVMTIVGAPLFEELLFRGVLLAGLRRALSRSRTIASTCLAVLVDGLLFSAAHAEWSIYVGLAIVGVVLAVIYARTRRLIPSIVTHASFNAAAVVAIMIARAQS